MDTDFEYDPKVVRIWIAGLIFILAFWGVVAFGIYLFFA